MCCVCAWTSTFRCWTKKGIIGGLDEVIPCGTRVVLVRMSAMRAGHNQWSLWRAQKPDRTTPTKLALTLRDGLQWTNGFCPVTSTDVKYSFQRIAGSGSVWACQFEKFGSVGVLDARSWIIHQTESFKPSVVIALPYCGGHIVCKAAVEAAGRSDTTEIPAECGPCPLETWEQNARVTLTANPGLARTAARLCHGRNLHRAGRSGGAAGL